ncbi:MAG: monofunctional biosynthetic peptidoglycan transglycosylase [Ignavibacteriae bacterium HGW-Ignavibacteriae-3]|nr:MAG: monofunctional biosynthetic peptidoglycan transglycosylase [Ignavibacteriae bacterium HGW-Ignavibacteriae-3]
MKIIWRIIKFCASLFLLYTAISIFVILFFRFVDPPVSAFINSKTSPLSGLFSVSDVNQKSVNIQKVSKYAVLAVIASEDQKFFEHFGFDFDQIEKAIKENERKKNLKRNKVRGASTVSMQLAKNLFLNPGKNLIRKGIEAYYTLLLELLWSKERIMEVYINLAETGNGIYGIEAASMTYYKKTSSKLNASEAATIIAILPNPQKRDPRTPTSYLINRRDNILQQMNLIGGVHILKDEIDY